MTPRRLRSFIGFTAVFVLAAGVVGARGQRPSGRPAEAQAAGPAGPITVDFMALTADGKPVVDLKADQLQIKMDGKDRPIKALELVQFRASAAGAPALPPPFGTNDMTGTGRSIIMVIDEESIRPGLERLLHGALLPFLDALPPADRVGLTTVPRGTTTLAPTIDRVKAKEAVNAVKGRAPATSTSSERRCHTRDVLVALGSTLGAVGGSGTPNTVVFFSSGLVAPSTNAAAVGGADDCLLPTTEFQKIGMAADIAKAQFYLVRPEQSSERGLSDGLENVVGTAGGQMLFLEGQGEPAMIRIARETSAYYLATFDVEGAERNGANHRLELRSSRPEVTLRSRAGTTIPRAGAVSATPQSMLRESQVHRGLGLRTVAFAQRNDDAAKPVKVFALAEPAEPGVKLTAAASAMYDSTGKLIAQWTARPEELQRPMIVAALAAPAGTYRLRMAAVDDKGRAGTADYDLVAQLTPTGPAQMSGLILGVAGTTGFVPQLQFQDEAEIVTFFELYGRPTVAFGSLVEIAATADGAAIVSAQPQPAGTAQPDRFVFTARLAIGALKPGDYVVRAKLAFEGQPTGIITHTLRKVAK